MNFTLWIILWLLPGIIKIAFWPFKLSILHYTALFKGWNNVAQNMADEMFAKGVAQGKYPQLPDPQLRSSLLAQANTLLTLGAVYNGFLWLVAVLILV